jgi:murein DD-endopeptidase MepM/ murein hydrolase activator NlpD
LGYVDKRNMVNELIVQQQVNQRKPAGSPGQTRTQKTGAYPVQGYGMSRGPGAGVMTKINQQPGPVQRYYKKKESTAPVIHLPHITLPGTEPPPRKEKENPSVPRPSPVSPRKSLRVTRFTIIFLGGLGLFASIALNWPENFSTAFKISLLPGGVYHLEPGIDPGPQDEMTRYAGLNTPEPVYDDEIPLNMVETFAWESYTVQKGDSLSKIAARFSISMDAVVASNNISSAKLLRAGDVLRIPNMNGIPYTVKQGDSLSKISKSMGVPLEVILDANDIQSENIQPKTVIFIPGAKMRSEDLKLVLGELFIYPIRGRLTSPFGWRNDPISGARRYHAALDLAASTGTPVKAAMDGRISTVGLNSVYGKYIIITHSGGYQTMYAHLNATSVTQGSYAAQGAKIGEVGSTGYSTGPHLHFALYKNGRAINPLDLLKP